MTKKNLIPFTEKEEKLIEKIVDKRIRTETKFPLATALFATFGLVATFYGFEKLIDKVDLFVNNPWILLATGISVLIVSGTIYKKLN